MSLTVDLLSCNELLEILQSSPNATAIYTTDDIVIQMANDAMINIWGKNRSVVGKPLAFAVPELEGQPFVGMLQNVWRTGVTLTGSDTAAELLVNGQLQTFYFDFEYRAVKRPDGSTYCILHTAKDVTADVLNRKLIQAQKIKEKELNDELAVINEELLSSNDELSAINDELLYTNNNLAETQRQLHTVNASLAKSEDRLRNILEQAPVGMALLAGPDMKIEIANDAILKIWGRTADELIGKPHHIARPELVGQPINYWLEEVYQTGRPRVNNEITVWLYDQGNLREAYVNSIYQPLKDQSDNVIGVLIMLEDVTERLKSRKEVERVQEMFNMAVESAELGTWYTDTVSRKFTPSKRLKELFGYGVDEDMPYEAAVNQITDEYRTLVTEAVEAAIQKGESYDLEYPIIGYHDHKIRWVRATGKTYPATNGENPYFSGTILEITERKLDEIRKNDFIAMVSHELKTPLTSAKAYVQMLGSKAKKAKDSFTAGALDKVELQINKMNSLIKGFLDVARIEAGKIQLNVQPVHLNEILEEAVEDALLLSQSHDITTHECDDIVVDADRDKIGQVVNNFLTNAIKYSPKGKRIVLNCKHAGQEIVVSVTDEGMGIKPEDRSKLFDRFYRVDSKHTKTISGFGIGLYLCAEIIKLHHGRIWVESETGIGSTFFFSLPAGNESR